MTDALKTKSGEEPRLLIQLNDDAAPVGAFIIADTIIVAKMGPEIGFAVLALLAV